MVEVVDVVVSEVVAGAVEVVVDTPVVAGEVDDMLVDEMLVVDVAEAVASTTAGAVAVLEAEHADARSAMVSASVPAGDVTRG